MHPNTQRQGDNALHTDQAAAGAAQPAAAPLQWAIVELMGHARIAGAISQQVFGGAQLVQVDVPEVTVTEHSWQGDDRVLTTRTIPAHTRSLGAASIFSINWCDQLAATVAAHSIKHEVITPYSLQNALASLPPVQRAQMLALTAGTTVEQGGDDGQF